MLSVEGVRVRFGPRAVLDGVDLEVATGEVVALLGPSGSGKSTLLRCLNRLEVPTEGVVYLEGQPVGMRWKNGKLYEMRPAELAFQRQSMGMVFQGFHLFPHKTALENIIEAPIIVKKKSRSEAIGDARILLEKVGLAEKADAYPHQLSGGQQQRVMIAMALACEPKLLIADEPTTALDVTIQAQILDLIRNLRDETGTAIILITHDLGVVAEFADDVVVMYAGRIVEQASVEALFAEPQHPYTIGLLGSIPRLDLAQERLATIEGQVPMQLANVRGCAFAPRCPFADQRCREAAPPLADVGNGHLAACWNAPLALPAAPAAAQ
jgi:oligopeptide/dipeptide ABC transporter ATP-binding protein